MDKKPIIVASVVVALVLGGGIAAWSSTLGQTDAPDSTAIVSTNTTATPKPAQTPAPTSSSSEGVAPSEQFGPDEEGTDDTVGGSLDIEAWSATARAAVTQYLTWDTAESADSRSARLAPYFAAGATELTSVPAQAGEDLFSFEGFTSTVKMTNLKYAGFQAMSDDGKSYEIVVIADYDSAFRSAADAQDRSGTVTYTATFSALNPKVLTSLDQQ